MWEISVLLTYSNVKKYKYIDFAGAFIDLRGIH